MGGETILEMRNIVKRFPGVHALKQCRLDLRRGEVLALVGENGAGKSTMMKILTGIYPDYGGEIVLNGKNVHFSTIRDAQHSGVSMVHQELNMLNHLSVAKNIFIGRESDGFFYSERQLNQKAQALIDEFHIGVRPTDIVADLSVGKIQIVEIARAMSYPNTQVLILDEPTAALSAAEANELFGKVRELKAKGIAIIFISHRMGEIKKNTDRITVMRDGEYIGTVNTAETEMGDIIKMMVGREILEAPKQKSTVPADAPVVLKAENLCSKQVKNVSFELRKGEILGFAGLVGAGRTEVMRLLFGADKLHSGSISLNENPVKISTCKDAVKNGIAYLSEDRKRYGIVIGLSVQDNAVMASLEKYARGPLLDKRKAARDTGRYVSDLRIKTPSIQELVRNLSGGNQQKVVITKWLIKDTEILIFDEPTRGIDVGAKAEIYSLIESLAAAKKSIILVSSDLTEVLRMSDRIVVMCEGRKIKELDIAEADQETIMHYATMYEVEGA
jgi:ribose transport system ATP-binding protein